LGKRLRVEGSSFQERLLDSFWAFCDEGLGMPLSEKPHREMIDFLSSPYSRSKLLLVPRDCWKTSLGSIAYPLWMVLRAYFIDKNPCYRAMIDSATVRLSKMVIQTIRDYVKNSAPLQMAFGDLYAKKGDVGEGLSLSFRMETAAGIKEPNFLASGVGAEKTGLHFELINMDDIVTKENIYTPTGREKTYNHYRMMYGIVESSKKEGANTVIQLIGTRYHDDDVYGRIIKDDIKAVKEGEQPLFTTLIRQAVDAETGELFYPDKLDHHALEKKKRQMKGLFWAQYMNDPNQESAPFKPSWLRWKSQTEFPELFRIRLTVDPAFKEDENIHGDYACLIVAGWDRFHQLWVIDVTMDDAMTPAAFVDEFYRLSAKYQVEGAVVEGHHQESMQQLLRLEAARRGYSVPTFWPKRSGNVGKMSRWTALQPYAERGGIRMASEIPESTKVEIQDEWERAPVATHDDFMDALELHTLFLPLEVEEGLGRVTFGGDTGGRELDVIADARRVLAMQSGLSNTTLADRFPHIRALKNERDREDEPTGESSDLYAELAATFKH
jgi:hypothetical protein